LRFAVVGPLLSSPPARGELKPAIEALAERLWRHPVSGEDVRFAFSTIEAWHYRAKKARDPIGRLRRAARKDLGKRVAISDELKKEILAQYRTHKDWSYKLHVDNLAALIEERSALGPMPSYSTIRRFMKENGLLKQKSVGARQRPGQLRAQKRFESREVRSYEVEHVSALWHLDFHHASSSVLTPDGSWVKPILLSVVDDYSRLCCHAQWYLEETTETLVHGFSQALAKRGLPRAALSANGAPMISEEFREGLAALSVIAENTLPYSPYQNAKQEIFFATIEGRLMKMVKHLPELTLSFLNDATLAWVEMEYNRSRHEEIKVAPLERFLHGPDVSRPAPSSEKLRLAFRRQVSRTQRRSDGTVSLDGVRFEVPDRFRHFERLTLRYPHWDFGLVHLVDPRSGALLAPIYPLDKAKNAAGKRHVRTPGALDERVELERRGVDLPPLLRKLMRDYSATGLPPAYIPKTPKTEDNS
jgi:transposase InsO family protein